MDQTFALSPPLYQANRAVRVATNHSETKSRIAQQRIRRSSHAEVRGVRCEVRNGILYLRGTVTSFYLKQLSQEAVRTLEGIAAISNDVEVIGFFQRYGSGTLLNSFTTPPVSVL
jgi:osmotically-inducible protein OsmY